MDGREEASQRGARRDGHLGALALFQNEVATGEQSSGRAAKQAQSRDNSCQQHTNTYHTVRGMDAYCMHEYFMLFFPYVMCRQALPEDVLVLLKMTVSPAENL